MQGNTNTKRKNTCYKQPSGGAPQKKKLVFNVGVPYL